MAVVTALETMSCVYQPIVVLDKISRTNAANGTAVNDDAITGYEALGRYPDGRVAFADTASSRSGEDPNAHDPLQDLDRACRLAALNGALRAQLARSSTLFVNVEPASRELAPRTTFERQVYASAAAAFQIVMEVTERSLLEHAGNVLSQVRWAREQGWGVAVDDVGADPASLAMLPFIAPDVVKLDLALVRTNPDADQARTLTAVMAYAERTGAAVLAEGIETSAHLEQALAVGATLGQGWFFAYPGPLPPAPVTAGRATAGRGTASRATTGRATTGRGAAGRAAPNGLPR